jgi:hypothetical protein
MCLKLTCHPGAPSCPGGQGTLAFPRTGKTSQARDIQDPPTTFHNTHAGDTHEYIHSGERHGHLEISELSFREKSWKR